MEQNTIELATAAPAMANFSVEREALLQAVKFLQMRVIERRCAVPAFAAVKIVASPCGSIAVTARSENCSAEVTLAGDVIEPGEVMADAKLLRSALTKAEKGRALAIEQDSETRATVKAGRARFKLPLIKPADHWRTPTRNIICGREGPLPLPVSFVVDPAQFMADLKAIAPAIAKEDIRRPYLQGFAIQVRELAERPRLVSVATNGLAMAVASRDVPEGAENLPDILIPGDVIPAILEAGKIAAEPVRFSYQRGQRPVVMLEMGSVALWLRPMAGEDFPDWQRVFEHDALAPTEEIDAPLFPELLPHKPFGQMAALGKGAPAEIDWQPTNRGMIGSVESDHGLVYVALNRASDEGLAMKGFTYAYQAKGETRQPVYSVAVEGDSEYPLAVNSSTSRIHLDKDQVAALCGDCLFDVLEFPGADGKPRYVSKWVYDQGDSRLLLVGSDGKCPKEGAPREYVTREQVEAALAGEVVQYAPEQPQEREADIPAPPQPETTETAPSAPEIAAEPVSEPATDPIAEIMARLDALEASLAAPLPVEPEVTEPVAPTGAIKPKRTPAHERAIRRAWAERKAARLQRAIAADHMRMREQAQSALLLQESEAKRMRQHLEGKVRAAQETRDIACRLTDRERDKRRRSTILARDLQKRLNAEHRLVDRANEKRREAEQALQERNNDCDTAKDARERAENRTRAVEAEIARLKRDMADPSQPERASDIAQLVRERDAARTANAALQQRCERAEAANRQGAEAIEGLVSRISKAEARLRELDRAA